MTPICLVLADDHVIVRQGLRALLESQPDLRVVGETGDGLEALDLAERLRPDVMVIDLMMPGLNGLEVAALVRRRHPEAQVLIMSGYTEHSVLRGKAITPGTNFLQKPFSGDELVRMVRAVLDT